MQEVRMLVRQGGAAADGALMESSHVEAAAEAAQAAFEKLLSGAEELSGLQAEVRSVGVVGIREGTVWSPRVQVYSQEEHHCVGVSRLCLLQVRLGLCHVALRCSDSAP